MLEINTNIKSNVTGKTYTITWASSKITMAEVGFAKTESEGEEYFIKRLLNMKYPLDSSPGSPKMKAMLREKCEKNYQKYSEIYNSIKNGCGEEGACVPIIDYFREGSFYYTVYRKIDASSLTLEEISKLPEKEKYKLLLRLVQGLHPMHTLGIIHGDLKPDNLLVQRHDGNWKIRLIDMNDCYRTGQPNEPGAVVGTPDYYSPELTKYNTYEVEDWDDEEELKKVSLMAKSLTVKSDIFALGIIFNEFFTGERPTILNKDINSISDAAVEKCLKISDECPKRIKDLIESMLEVDQNKRPTLNQISDVLKSLINSNKNLKEPQISFIQTDDGKIRVNLASENPGAEIFYTSDNSEPDKHSNKYTEPFEVEKFTTIKAICFIDEKKSPIKQQEAWIKQKGLKTLSPSPVICIKGRNVVIKIEEPSTKSINIYYTKDGSRPNLHSILYTGPFETDNETTIIRAISKEEGENKLPSKIAEAKVYKAKVLKPIIHYNKGNISMESENKILYTLDGSKPLKTSQVYTGPFTLEDTSKFHIIAVSINEEGNMSDCSEIQRPNPHLFIK